MSLSYTLLSISKITPQLRHEMFELFSQYYFDVTFDRFSSDLSEKNSVIMLWDNATKQNPLLFGFSTVLINRLADGSRTLYSGDTVVHCDYWGSRILQTAFSQVLLQTRIKHPVKPLYWMLLSKGFKTYMLMRRNFPVSYPSLRGEIPSQFATIQQTFYQKKFDVNFKSQLSQIDFGHSLGRVKDQHAVATERDLRSPDVRFFLEKNPRSNEGVELACIAQIRWIDIINLILKYVMPFGGKKKSRVSSISLKSATK